MIGRILLWIVSFVALVLLVTLGVANRQVVPLVLDPFNPAAPLVTLRLPFFAYLFGALIAGVIVGGFATWLTQGKWRRLARTRTQDMLRWRGEAERLQREREESLGAAGGGQAGPAAKLGQGDTTKRLALTRR